MKNCKTILFVEDDPDDRELISEAMSEVNTTVKTVFAENGLQAIAYLSDVRQTYELPCLIVLDLNMPLLDGKETYWKIKNDLKLENVPVVIFTSSHNPGDKNLFTSLGVDFINKPSNFSFMNEIVSRMIHLCKNRNEEPFTS